jgi:hypothetical protein
MGGIEMKHIGFASTGGLMDGKFQVTREVTDSGEILTILYIQLPGTPVMSIEIDERHTHARNYLDNPADL